MMGIQWYEKFLIRSTLSILFYLMLANQAYPVTETKLLASDGADTDEFGYSVSISGNVAVVGARDDDDNGLNSGSAYVFRWNGASWVEEQKLIASDGVDRASFGYSISISGNVIIVGAPMDDDNGLSSGSAYIFRWNGANWVEEQKLVASDGAEADLFGNSVSVSGDVAIVGAHEDDDNGLSSGSAYIFRWNGGNWVEEQKILASDGSHDDVFGESVSISGDVVLVGARGDGDMGLWSGSAYVFRWNGASWVEEQKLIASDGAEGDRFGWSVSISGDIALVDASADDDNGLNSGSAYVFRWNGVNWVEEQKLLASDGAEYDHFGRSVSISRELVVVGAHGDDDNGADSGSAYVFRWNGSSWVEEQKLIASDGATNDEFSYTAISISGDVVLVGVYGDDDCGGRCGSAYVYDLELQGEDSNDSFCFIGACSR